MAPARVVPTHRRKIPSTKIDVCCNICQSQIGVCNNEWIRLTSAYARPKDRGMSFGTRVGDTTRTVPEGVAHKMAAGCEMAELFCEACDTVVGQYCKRAPDRKREQMVGQHFYKFSKTRLRDARTTELVDPVFAAENVDLVNSPRGRSSAVAPTNTSSPVPRPRTAAASKSSPQQSNGCNPRDQQDGGNESPFLRGAADNQNGLMNRLLDLERLVRAGSIATPAPLQQNSHGLHDYSRPGISDQIIEDQKKQIESLNTQMITLRSTIDDLRGVIQDLREEKARRQCASLKESAVLNHFDEMIRSARDNQSTSAETDFLRAENQRLQERLSTIAGAVGVSADELIQKGRSSQTDDQHSATNPGKRKREDEPPSRVGFRPGDTYSGGDSFHPLTPESMQELVAARGPTPAQYPPLQNQSRHPSYQHYAPPPLRVNYGDPNTRQYGVEAPGFAPQPMYYHPPPPPPPTFPGNDNNHLTPMMSCPESRMIPRPPQPGPPESVRGERSTNRDLRGASGNNVEFSDDEIATANASDAPLSIPRPRPLPPPSVPSYPLSYPLDNPPRGMCEARPFSACRTPAARRKHVPRSLTCTSLRQPATGYGLNNALHFTPDLVKQRIPKKKSEQPSVFASTENTFTHKKELVSEPGNILERPGTVRPLGQPDEIPIDPALEAQDFEESRAEIEDVMKKRSRARSQANTTDEGNDDDDDGPYKPGRSSARKTTQRKNVKGRSKKSALERIDDHARIDDVLEKAA